MRVVKSKCNVILKVDSLIEQLCRCGIVPEEVALNESEWQQLKDQQRLIFDNQESLMYRGVMLRKDERNR